MASESKLQASEGVILDLKARLAAQILEGEAAKVAAQSQAEEALRHYEVRNIENDQETQEPNKARSWET